MLGWDWGRVVEGECGCQALCPCYQWGECVSPAAITHRREDSPRQSGLAAGQAGALSLGEDTCAGPLRGSGTPWEFPAGEVEAGMLGSREVSSWASGGVSGLGDPLPSVKYLRPQPMTRLALLSQLPPPCLALQPKKITLPS